LPVGKMEGKCQYFPPWRPVVRKVGFFGRTNIDRVVERFAAGSPSDCRASSAAAASEGVDGDILQGSGRPERLG
jgi:hypothetical protein